MTRIVLVDDHQVLRDGIRRSLEDAGEEVVGEAGDGEEAVAVVAQTRPDVVLMDLEMPVLDGVESCKRILAQFPTTLVVVLTMHEEVARTRAALSAGAVAYLTKGTSMNEVIDAIRNVVAGETVLSVELAMSILRTADENGEVNDLLSDRQVEILQRIADGLSTKQVARELGISHKTVYNHLNAIYRRLDTQSLTHAVLSAVRKGIIHLDSGE
ncbi:response regulator [Candidatus Neomicrothrix sp.]|jgi:DNA-binding NarL/FixJ family response regulator|uniref:response regulator n=1 Tax=Candidatus Neomicrothrix sp. TaxID=2719034 RepID=UPI001B6A0B9E|nr:response regulator transcription factor [Candidatus Microthrix sp.]MBK6501576.1 response regulator transcription factor [Candidatus Microthrix sp.]MBK7019133.1 response regulator transcription factor [Candidatus Microthrix sp.]MBP6151407.1 response regulator transcription factor [Candidatus Microthrix sp.]MBP7404949.1 response regulator transcription factor [Candidatus Microthrix sp.]MBP7853597.1 response regulator transcription factor [Candidatus Microthrix sp.]